MNLRFPLLPDNARAPFSFGVFRTPTKLLFAISLVVSIHGNVAGQEWPVVLAPDATASGLPAISFESGTGVAGYLEVPSNPQDFDGRASGVTTIVVFRPNDFPDGQRLVSSAYGTVHPEQHPGPHYQVNTTMISDGENFRGVHVAADGSNVGRSIGGAGPVSTTSYTIGANVWHDDGVFSLIRMAADGDVFGNDFSLADADPQDHLFTRIGAASDADLGVVQPLDGEIAAVLVYDRKLTFGPGEEFGQVMNFLYDVYMTPGGGDPDQVPVTDGLVLHLNASNVVDEDGEIIQVTDLSGRGNDAEAFIGDVPMLVEWNNLTEGDWHVAENWDPQVVPRDSDEVLVWTGGTVFLSDDRTVGAIDIRNGSELVIEADASLTTTGEDGSNQDLRIREGGGSLTVFGDLQVETAQLGRGDVADGDIAAVTIDGGRFIANDRFILTAQDSGAEMTLLNGAVMQAQNQFAEWGPTQEFSFAMEKGTTVRLGTGQDGVGQFNEWIADGRISTFGDGLSAWVGVQTIDGREWAVLTIIEEQTFSAWQEQHFSATELGRPEISGERANPSGDGMANLLKYALGLDPWEASTSGLPVLEVAELGETLLHGFEGPADEPLHGTPLDEGSAEWIAGENFRADGAVYGHRSAAIADFFPLPGYVYSLESTFTATTDRWIALGFANNRGYEGQSGSAAGWRFSNTADGTADGVGWLIHRDDPDADNQAFFGGPGAAEAAGAGNFASGLTDFRIDLDTTREDWEVTFYVNGVEQGRHTYDGAAPINAVGFSLVGPTSLTDEPIGHIESMELTATPSDFRYLTLSFTRPVETTDLSYRVLETNTLQQWTDGPVLHSSQGAVDGTVTETWRSSEPLSEAARSFLKLEVELEE